MYNKNKKREIATKQADVWYAACVIAAWICASGSPDAWCGVAVNALPRRTRNLLCRPSPLLSCGLQCVVKQRGVVLALAPNRYVVNSARHRFAGCGLFCLFYLPSSSCPFLLPFAVSCAHVSSTYARSSELEPGLPTGRSRPRALGTLAGELYLLASRCCAPTTTKIVSGRTPPGVLTPHPTPHPSPSEKFRPGLRR